MTLQLYWKNTKLFSFGFPDVKPLRLGYCVQLINSNTLSVWVYKLVTLAMSVKTIWVATLNCNWKMLWSLSIMCIYIATRNQEWSYSFSDWVFYLNLCRPSRLTVCIFVACVSAEAVTACDLLSHRVDLYLCVLVGVNMYHNQSWSSLCVCLSVCAFHCVWVWF